MLTGQLQGRAARDQDPETRRAVQELGDHDPCIDHLLEVVQDQEGI